MDVRQHPLADSSHHKTVPMHKFAEGGLVARRNKIAQQIYIGSSCAFIHALTTAFYYRSRRSWRSFLSNLKDLYPVETGNPVVDLGVGWRVVTPSAPRLEKTGRLRWSRRNCGCWPQRSGPNASVPWPTLEASPGSPPTTTTSAKFARAWLFNPGLLKR